MSTLKNNLNSHERNHANLPSLVITISVAFLSLFDLEGKFGKVLTQALTPSKTNLLSHIRPVCEKLYFFSCDIMSSVFIVLPYSHI